MAFEIGVPQMDFNMRVEIDEAPGFELANTILIGYL